MFPWRGLLLSPAQFRLGGWRSFSLYTRLHATAGTCLLAGLDAQLPISLRPLFPAQLLQRRAFSAFANRLWASPAEGRGSNTSAEKETAPHSSEAGSGASDGGGGGGSSSGGSEKGPSSDSQRPSIWHLVPIGIALLVGIPVALDLSARSGMQEINFQEFVDDFLRLGKVDRLVVVNGKQVDVYLKDPALMAAAIEFPVQMSGIREPASATAGEGSGNHQGSSSSHRATYHFTIGSVEGFEERLEAAARELGISSSSPPVYYKTEASWTSSLMTLAPTVLLIAGFLYFNRQAANMMGGGAGGGLFGIGRARPTVFNKETALKVTFNEVAGMDEAKVEVMEFVDFLKNPQRFLALGARIPKGALLVGPPGTGKTLLAKAVAGEAGVPFLSISGSEFLEMFVGVGPSRVRDLFAQARKQAPCIIFIDEIDAVGRQRGYGGLGGASEERDNTLNQLLVEMDGFSSSSGVIVLAGTNRAEVLDKALLRPGRFDRQISVDAPDLGGREAIFKIHLKQIILDLSLSRDAVAKQLAELTPGFVGADIANVCNEAALIAARRSADGVTVSDFRDAIERIVGGLERKARRLSDLEKRVVAYHEAGHAVVGWFTKYTDPLMKVSIVPRGRAALGYAQYLPQERYIITQEQLMDMMCMTLGGRASEEIFFSHLSSGAHDDLQKVTRMAYTQVVSLGMSSQLGPVSFPMPDQADFGVIQRPYSQATAFLIDEEVQSLVAAAYTRTKELLQQHRDSVEKLARLLLQKEVLNKEDLLAVLGQRPHAPRGHVFEDIGLLDNNPAAVGTA